MVELGLVRESGRGSVVNPSRRRRARGRRRRGSERRAEGEVKRSLEAGKVVRGVRCWASRTEGRDVEDEGKEQLTRALFCLSLTRLRFLQASSSASSRNCDQYALLQREPCRPEETLLGPVSLLPFIPAPSPWSSVVLALQPFSASGLPLLQETKASADSKTPRRTKRT